MAQTFTSSLRNELLLTADVSRLSSLRRSTSVFSQGQAADALYFIDEGLVKLTRSSLSGGKIILSICGPGHLAGEEALSEDAQSYCCDAEVLSAATVFRVPRESLRRTISAYPGLATALVSYLLEQKLALAHRVELLCLHDVEYRILYYLAELSTLVKVHDDTQGYQLPITQLELADLIGATRETTSTTLNLLERRGLLKLSRRLLTISSPSTLRAAAKVKAAATDDGFSIS
ncbi:MAG TPA: Crp/Fnr family transcriptional regulator [Bryobacteraceae bacterium]